MTSSNSLTRGALAPSLLELFDLHSSLADSVYLFKIAPKLAFEDGLHAELSSVRIGANHTVAASEP